MSVRPSAVRGSVNRRTVPPGSAFTCVTPGRASPTPTSRDCLHPFERRRRLCDPEAAPSNSSWELTVGSSSKEIPAPGIRHGPVGLKGTPHPSARWRTPSPLGEGGHFISIQLRTNFFECREKRAHHRGTETTETTEKRRPQKLWVNKSSNHNPYPRGQKYFSLWSLCTLWWTMFIFLLTLAI